MKGLQYTGVDDLRLPTVVRALPSTEREAWVARFNEQWAIVDKCLICGEDLIAGERADHRLAHVSASARTVARMLYDLRQRDPVAALEAISAVDEID